MLDVFCFCGHLVQGVGLPWFCLVPALCNTEIAPLAFLASPNRPKLHKLKSPLFAQAQERMAAQGAHKPLHKAKVLEKTLCGLVQAPISQTLCTLVFRVLALCIALCTLCAIFF